MFRNNFAIALRHFSKNKLNSAIIVLGLGTGIACSILSFLFIRDELDYDRFHDHLNQIHEVKMVLALPIGRAVASPWSNTALSLRELFPEVVRSVRMEKLDASVRREGDVYDEKILAADPSFLEMFSFPLLSGTPASALRDPDSLILTRESAAKYFGDVDVIGEKLSLRLEEGFLDLRVTGVLEDIPGTSSLDFGVLINLEAVYGSSLNDSNNTRSLSCFIQLEEGTKVDLLLDKFKTSIDRPLQERYSPESGHLLQPLKDFHLRSEYGSQILSGSSTFGYSLILAAISLLVLIVACFNFMNLSIGSTSNRLVEIGIRKVLGSRKKQLVGQYWIESLVFALFSFLSGLLMAELFLPTFNRISRKDLHIDLFSNPWTIVFYVGLIGGLGIFSGSYPAFFLSKFSSVDLFRGKMKMSKKMIFNRWLIVFQFTVSIFLVIGSIFLLKQKVYMARQNPGYDTEGVVVIPLKNPVPGYSENTAFVSILRNRLLPLQAVHDLSGASFGMPEGWIMTNFQGLDGEPNLVAYNHVDEDFLPTLNIHLARGRNFSNLYPSDKGGSVIVNQSLADRLDVEDPVGHSLNEFFDTDFDRKIIGVVEDFHYESLHDPIFPAFLGLGEMDARSLFVKVEGQSLRDALQTVEKEFKALAPQVPFDYSFLEQDIARQYEKEDAWTRMIQFASLFALLIACSGLFGVTLQVVFQRTKEISIRRVLGASTREIFSLINKEFIRLVLLANLLAWPAAYLAVTVFLRNYAFRIPVAPWVFLLSGFLALALAAATVGVHILRIARTIPSMSLKYE